MSRIDDEFTVKSELLQLFMAGVNVMLPARFTKSCSVIALPAFLGSVLFGVALQLILRMKEQERRKEHKNQQ